MTANVNREQGVARRALLKGAAGAGAMAVIGRPAFAQTAQYTLKWANNIPATHPSTIRVKEAADAIRKET
ncbi:MAG: hypothetical protein JSR49_05685, partial [Proteobacteria bacterium]|nr:hypothetical protein [Pseudomonadota bacterium]